MYHVLETVEEADGHLRKRLVAPNRMDGVHTEFRVQNLLWTHVKN